MSIDLCSSKTTQLHGSTLVYINEESIHAGISFIHNLAKQTTLMFQEGAGHEIIIDSVVCIYQVNFFVSWIPVN